MISVKDLRPISICNGEGFRKYSRALNPIYLVPCHTTIHIMLMYKENTEIVMRLLAEAGGSVSTTTDMWANNQTHDYMTVTCDFENDN